MTADEVVTHFEQSIGQFWTAEHSEVRRMLTRVLEAGLVKADVAPTDGSSGGETYRLAPRGRAVLEDWMRSAPEVYPNRAAFLLRLYFAANLDAGLVSAMLDARIDAVHAGLAALQLMAGQEGGGPEASLQDALALATVHNGIAHAQAEVDWALDWRDRMRERQAPVDGSEEAPPCPAAG